MIFDEAEARIAVEEKFLEPCSENMWCLKPWHTASRNISTGACQILIFSVFYLIIVRKVSNSSYRYPCHKEIMENYHYKFLKITVGSAPIIIKHLVKSLKV